VIRSLVLATGLAHIFGGTPAAVDYRATITSAPRTVEARIVAGDKLWLKLPNGQIHEHRLYALHERWRIPAGRFGIVSGTLVRLPRPPIWPWIVVAVLLVAAAAAAFRRRRVAVVFPVLAALAAVTAYAAHTGSAVMLVLLPILGAAALAALVPHSTRLVAVLAIGAFAVYTGVALAPMLWRALPLSSLPAAVARATVVVALVAGAASCVLFLTSSAAREWHPPDPPAR
jgi:hypothetical protein